MDVKSYYSALSWLTYPYCRACEEMVPICVRAVSYTHNCTRCSMPCDSKTSNTSKNSNVLWFKDVTKEHKLPQMKMSQIKCRAIQEILFPFRSEEKALAFSSNASNNTAGVKALYSHTTRFFYSCLKAKWTFRLIRSWHRSSKLTRLLFSGREEGDRRCFYSQNMSKTMTSCCFILNRMLISFPYK